MSACSTARGLRKRPAYQKSSPVEDADGGEQMNLRTAGIVAATASLCVGVALTTSDAVVRPSLKEQLVGSWTTVAIDNVLEDGSRVQSYGANPDGMLMLDADGQFSLILIRSNLPKFASNNRDRGTAEENQAVMQGSLANYGTYSVNEADRILVLRIEGSSFPNWKGTEQRRLISSVSQTELKWRNPVASNGGTAQIVLQRTKPPHIL
jgi:hypothetical protein